MTIYKCYNCNFVGYAYGTPFMGGKSGVSHPWCPCCGLNNKLEKIKESKENMDVRDKKIINN